MNTDKFLYELHLCALKGMLIEPKKLIIITMIMSNSSLISPTYTHKLIYIYLTYTQDIPPFHTYAYIKICKHMCTHTNKWLHHVLVLSIWMTKGIKLWLLHLTRWFLKHLEENGKKILRIEMPVILNDFAGYSRL